jgi:hypothetical protein
MSLCGAQTQQWLSCHNSTTVEFERRTNSKTSSCAALKLKKTDRTASLIEGNDPENQRILFFEK